MLLGAIIGVLLVVLFFGYLMFFVKTDEEELREKGVSEEEIKKITLYKSEIKFQDRQTKNFLMQAFESIHILRTTKNIKTFKSRLELFEKRYFQLVQVSSKTGYLEVFYAIKDQYPKKYYDRSLTKEMLKLETPREFNYDAFIESIFSKFVNRLKTETDNKINSLKTDKAKENARIKLENNLNELWILIDELGFSENKNLKNIFSK